MAILASLLPLVTHSPVPTAMAPVRPVAPVIIRPLFWLAPDGMAYLNGRPTPYEKFGEVRVLRGRGGVQFDFRGTNGAIRLPDLPDLRLTGSLSIAMWIAPRQYWRS
ncbi:MAG: hypothetical protein SFX74_12900, partial [Fimbriimonadaceae bacterium]|nr:hypothetical protein [Fimbriimonadaceae bacterium]